MWAAIRCFPEILGALVYVGYLVLPLLPTIGAVVGILLSLLIIEWMIAALVGATTVALGRRLHLVAERDRLVAERDRPAADPD